MKRKSTTRLALRHSRPHPHQFFGIMLIFSHRSFSWSLTRKTLLWIAGWALGCWILVMLGSAYGFWATKKLMSFSQLQRETRTQQEQLRQALDQATQLQNEITQLTQQMNDLGHLIDPRAPNPVLPPPPGSPIGPPQPTAPGKPDIKRISALHQDLERTRIQAQRIQARMDPIIDRWNHTPSIWPTAGYLSSGYGIRMNPFLRFNEAGESLLGFHKGFDITNAEGTPIQATAHGIVEIGGWYEGYGNAVILRHSTQLETLYGHMSKVFVQPGQQVSRGDILGAMGQTGNATGPHLHYEVRVNGNPVDPGPYMHLQRQWLSGLKG